MCYIIMYNSIMSFGEFCGMKKQPISDQRIEAIGKRLRELRIEKGYRSYDFFAWENKIPRMQYLNMEQGKNFTLKSLLRVLDIHKISLEEFFKGFK